MKAATAIVILSGFAGVVLAQQSVPPDSLGSWQPQATDSCNTVYGTGRDVCLANHYHMQQEQKVRDQLVALQRAQEENEQLHNELLQRELTQRSAPPALGDISGVPGFADWQADNRWFGADRPRTEYALLYARELHQQQPELAGRPFLNALSARVRDVFAPTKR